MIDNTINDGKTIPSGDKDMILYVGETGKEVGYDYKKNLKALLDGIGFSPTAGGVYSKSYGGRGELRRRRGPHLQSQGRQEQVRGRLEPESVLTWAAMGKHMDGRQGRKP